MASNILSDYAIKHAKPKAKEYLLSDGNDLYLRIRPDGSKSWQFIYTFNGKRHKMGLGSLLQTSLKTARELAQIAHNDLASSLNPSAAKEERKAALEAQKATAKTESTLSDLFSHWLKTDLIRRKDQGKEVSRMFHKDVLPRIGHIKAKEANRTHITEVTDALLTRGTPRMAKLIFSLMRQMLRFGVDRGVIDFDPTASIRKANIGGKDTERDRVLSTDEIKELAVKITAARLQKSTECAIWLALSTCARIGEILKARWEHINLQTRQWRIPSEHSKNGKAHTVQLSDFALERFRELQTISGTQPWCFPNRSNTDAVCSKTVTKQIGDRQREASPMKGRSKSSKSLTLAGGKWTPHDLRRTGATLMVASGVLPEVAERCLNHKEENKVKRTYQHHTYEKEMGEAWNTLGRILESLTNNI